MGWVQVSLGIVIFKSSQNSPKLVLIFWGSIPCVFCLYIKNMLLKVVSHFDLSVLSISVIGLQKNILDRGGGLGEFYPCFF